MVKRRALISSAILLPFAGCSVLGPSKIDKSVSELLVSEDFFSGLQATGAGMNPDYYPSGYEEIAEELFNLSGTYSEDENDDRYIVHFVLNYGSLEDSKTAMDSWKNWLVENEGTPTEIEVGDHGLIASDSTYPSAISVYRKAQFIIVFDEWDANDGSTSVSSFAERHHNTYF